jgi:hypothetical protein
MAAEENSNSQIFLVERRREEKRILVNVPVEVTIVNGAGAEFTDRTFIEDVSDLGCRFTTRGLAQPGDTVSLKLAGPRGKNLPNEEPRLYKIMWVARNEHSSTVGARLVKGEKLASIDSSAEKDAPRHDVK